MTDGTLYTAKINKSISNARSAEYSLTVTKDGARTICSIDIRIGGEEATAYDVCESVHKAEEFLNILADGEVEPCHLKDIVYDILPM